MEDTRIVEIKHIDGDWHQYDVKLNFAYGWSYLLKSAQNFIDKDLLEVDELIAVNSKGAVQNLTDSLHTNNNTLRKCPEFIVESKALSLAGNSGFIKQPIKVIWFTQTQVMRVFSVMEVSDADLRSFLSNYILVA